MRIQLPVTLVVISLILALRPFSANAITINLVTITFTEPVDEAGNATVTAIDLGGALSPCGGTVAPPCTLSAVSGNEFATISFLHAVLPGSPSLFTPGATATAVLLQRLGGPISDLLTLEVLEGPPALPGTVQVNLGFRSDPTTEVGPGNVPPGFAFSNFETGGVQPILNFFTGPLSVPALQTQFDLPANLSIWARSDLDPLVAPEPSAFVLLGFGLAGIVLSRRRRFLKK
jgi:hypothetical protein